MTNLKEQTQEQKRKLLNDLILVKFGDQRGAKNAAFKASGVKASPYFYNMTNGHVPVSNAVLQKLSALPDYEPDPLYIAPIDPVISAQYGDYVLHLNEETAELFSWFIQRLGGKPPFTARHLSGIFPDALRSYIETFAEHKFALKDYDEKVAKAAKSPAAAPEADAFD